MSEQAARARPIRFGSPGRALFGMLHTPATSATARAPVVLCPPFGQEAIRAHRTFKVLAERLARAGHTVLRFDYFGTGDSDGEDRDVSLSGMGADIKTADAHLREQASGDGMIWLGLGLGATAALRAAASAGVALAQLLLWDPVLDGQRYLEQLRDCHGRALEESLSLKPRNIPPATDVVEALGFGISPAFQKDLEALSVETLGLPPPSVVTTLCAPQDATGVARLVQRSSGQNALRTVDVRHDIDWLVESIDNGALVPAKALQTLVGLAGAAA